MTMYSTMKIKGQSLIGKGGGARKQAFHVAVLSVMFGKPAFYPSTRFANPCCRE